MASVVITVTNKTTGESHDGNDSGYDSLITNSVGEWSINLANFTNEYSNGDSIEISGVSTTHGGDTETTIVNTASGGETTINLVLVPDKIQMITNGINKVGERVDHRRYNLITYEASSGSIDSLGSATDTTMTIVHRVISDDRFLTAWGEIKEGEAIGYFKGKENLAKGDLIRVPRSTGDWWRIQNTPITHRLDGNNASKEARLILEDDR